MQRYPICVRITQSVGDVLCKKRQKEEVTERKNSQNHRVWCYPTPALDSGKGCGLNSEGRACTLRVIQMGITKPLFRQTLFLRQLCKDFHTNLMLILG